MIIDFHTHTFPDKIAGKAVQKLGRSSRIRAYADGTAEGLRRNAEAAGIGLSVIQPVATSPSQVEHINTGAIQRNTEEAAWEAAGGGKRDIAGIPERGKREAAGIPEPAGEQTGSGINRSRLLSFGCIHPEYENIRGELRRIAEAGVPGIKLHPYFHGCDMDDIRYLRILDAAAENGLIVLTHAGYDQGFPGEHSCMVPMLRRIMQEFRGLTMIAAHMGGWKEWELVPELLADTGIYLDTSFATGRLEPEKGEESYWEVDHFAPDPGMTTYREREERQAENRKNCQSESTEKAGSVDASSEEAGKTGAVSRDSEEAGKTGAVSRGSEEAGKTGTVSRGSEEAGKTGAVSWDSEEAGKTGAVSRGSEEAAGTKTVRAYSAPPETDERDIFRETAKKRSVFGTAKLLEPEQFAEIVRAFPEGHILFGTDSPWTDPERSIAFIRSAPLPEETKHEILGGAAERLLKNKVSLSGQLF